MLQIAQNLKNANKSCLCKLYTSLSFLIVVCVNTCCPRRPSHHPVFDRSQDATASNQKLDGGKAWERGYKYLERWIGRRAILCCKPVHKCSIFLTNSEKIYTFTTLLHWPPPFVVLWFAFSLIHRSGRVANWKITTTTKKQLKMRLYFYLSALFHGSTV